MHRKEWIQLYYRQQQSLAKPDLNVLVQRKQPKTQSCKTAKLLTVRYLKYIFYVCKNIFLEMKWWNKKNTKNKAKLAKTTRIHLKIFFFPFDFSNAPAELIYARAHCWTQSVCLCVSGCQHRNAFTSIQIYTHSYV